MKLLPLTELSEPITAIALNPLLFDTLRIRADENVAADETTSDWTVQRRVISDQTAVARDDAGITGQQSAEQDIAALAAARYGDAIASYFAIRPRPKCREFRR